MPPPDLAVAPPDPPRKRNLGRPHPRAGADPDGLVPKMRAFVTEFLRNGGNGTQAAIVAGYAEGTAAQQATSLLKHPRVSAAIGRLKGKAIAKLERQAVDALVMDKREVLTRLSEIGRAHDPEDASAVQVRAVELVGKEHGLFGERLDVRVQSEPSARMDRLEGLLLALVARAMAPAGASSGDQDAGRVVDVTPGEPSGGGQ